MKNCFLRTILAVLLVAALLMPAALGEDLSVEGELYEVDEHGITVLEGDNLFDMESTDLSQTVELSKETLAELEPMIDKAKDGDQVVSNAIQNGSCEHKRFDMIEGLGHWEDHYTPAGKYWHMSNHVVSGEVEMECEDCGAVFTGGIPSKTNMIVKSMCFPYKGKCAECGQKISKCSHKSKRKVDKVYGYESLTNDMDCLYFDNSRHAVRVLIPNRDDSIKVQLWLCNDCGALGTETWEDGDYEGIGWWTGDEISLVAIECEEYYVFQSHNYVNGICTGCGHVKSLPTVKLSTTALTLAVKEKHTLPTQAIPAGVSFKSSNKKIATVNAQTGVVTAKKKGTATIKAIYNGIELASCKVTVKKAPSKVSLNKSKVTINADATYQLMAKIPSGSYTSKYTWSSSNSNIATVDGNGLVKGISKGVAKITVKTANGKKATCKVTVTMPKVSPVSRSALVGEWVMYQWGKKDGTAMSFPVNITSVSDSGNVSAKWGQAGKKATGTWDEKRQVLTIQSDRVYVLKGGVLGGASGNYSGIAFKKNDERVSSSGVLEGKWRMTEHRKDANNDVIQFDIEVLSISGSSVSLAWGDKNNIITGKWNSATQTLTVYNGQTYLLRHGLLGGGSGKYSGVAYKTGN